MDQRPFDFRHHRITLEVMDTIDGWHVEVLHQSLSRPDRVNEMWSYSRMMLPEALQVLEDTANTALTSLAMDEGLTPEQRRRLQS